MQRAELAIKTAAGVTMAGTLYWIIKIFLKNKKDEQKRYSAIYEALRTPYGDYLMGAVEPHTTMMHQLSTYGAKELQFNTAIELKLPHWYFGSFNPSTAAVSTYFVKSAEKLTGESKKAVKSSPFHEKKSFKEQMAATKELLCKLIKEVLGDNIGNVQIALHPKYIPFVLVGTMNASTAACTLHVIFNNPVILSLRKAVIKNYNDPHNRELITTLYKVAKLMFDSPAFANHIHRLAKQGEDANDEDLPALEASDEAPDSTMEEVD